MALRFEGAGVVGAEQTVAWVCVDVGALGLQLPWLEGNDVHVSSSKKRPAVGGKAQLTVCARHWRTGGKTTSHS